MKNQFTEDNLIGKYCKFNIDFNGKDKSITMRIDKILGINGYLMVIGFDPTDNRHRIIQFFDDVKIIEQ